MAFQAQRQRVHRSSWHDTKLSWTLARAGDASSKKLGTFLVMSQFQGSVNSSAMFLTAAAQNLLCMKLAAELGVIIASPWITWFKVSTLNLVPDSCVRL